MLTFDKLVTNRMKCDVGGMLGGMFGGGGDDTSTAATDAASIQAQYQQDALDYLKQQEALPTEIRDQALKQMQGFYFTPEGQQQMIDRVQSNPMYQQQLKAGEEATLRTSSATGGLRGGGSIADVANYQNQLLSQGVNQQLAGLQGLAGMPSNANQIASMTAGIGQTLGQGQIAAAQNQQMGNQAGFGNMMGLANLGLQAYGAFSDERLKENKVKIGETSNPGISKYSWTWNDKAKDLGMSGDDSGYIAQEVEKVWPELVTTHSSGYKMIDTKGIEERLS